jgi:uncharacterized protein YqeY
MSLLEDIRKDMLEATKSGDTNASSILKMVIASIKNEEINIGKELTDEEVVKLLRREVKKIEDSISQFTTGNRLDLVEKEKSQLEVIEKYLPSLMSEEDIRKVVEAKVSELGVTDMKDMGRVMGVVMKELGDRADGRVVKEVLEGILGNE